MERLGPLNPCCNVAQSIVACVVALVQCAGAVDEEP